MLLIMKGTMLGKAEIKGTESEMRILDNAFREAKATGSDVIIYCDSDLKKLGGLSIKKDSTKMIPYSNMFLKDKLVFEGEEGNFEMMTVVETVIYDYEKYVIEIRINNRIRPYLDYLIRVYDHELGND